VKKNGKGQVQWLISIIPATWEVEIVKMVHGWRVWAKKLARPNLTQ
jgi:hypothetical protein